MVLQTRNKSLNKGIFSFLFAFSFILNGYASGIPGLSLGSVVFVYLVLYSLVKTSFTIPSKQPIVLIIILIFISIIDYCKVDNVLNSADIIKDISKYIIWACMISYCSYCLFEKDMILKWMERISYVLLLYLVIQYISFYGLSRYLPNIIEFGPFHAYDPGYASEELGEGFMIRPASFLSESSFLGNFFTATLIMILVEVETNYSKTYFYKALIVTLGVIMTTSTSAIIQIPIIWLLLGKNSFKNNKWLSTIFILTVVFVVVTVIGIFNTLGDSENALMYSLFYTFNKFDNLENSTRFGNSYAFLNYIPEYLKALGVGVGNEVAYLKNYVQSDHYYMNSVTLMLVQVGWLGFVIFLFYLLLLVIKSITYKQRGALVLIGLYFVHGFGSGMWLGTYGILFLFIANGYLVTPYKKQIKSCRTY